MNEVAAPVEESKEGTTKNQENQLKDGEEKVTITTTTV